MFLDFNISGNSLTVEQADGVGPVGVQFTFPRHYRICNKVLTTDILRV